MNGDSSLVHVGNIPFLYFLARIKLSHVITAAEQEIINTQIPNVFMIDQLAALVKAKKVRLNSNWPPHQIAKTLAVVFEGHLVADSIHNVSIAEAGMKRNSVIIGATTDKGESQICIHCVSATEVGVEFYFDALAIGGSRVHGKFYKTSDIHALLADIILWIDSEFEMVENGLDLEISDAVEYAAIED